MNIVVLLKQTPDTETRVKIKEGEPRLDEQGVNFIVNPYDEFAVDMALRLKERLGEGTVTLVCLGPDRAAEAIRSGLAMGADKAIHISDPACDLSDGLATAKCLAAAIKTIPYDLVLCGQRSIDNDNVQTGAMTAELLGIPHVYLAMSITLSDDKKVAVVEKQVEGGLDVFETPLPALITCQKGIDGIVEPRLATLPGIMKAKQKEVKKLTLQDLGIPTDQVGKDGSYVQTVEMFLPPPRGECKFIEGEPEEAAKELVRLLREEAKVL